MIKNTAIYKICNWSLKRIYAITSFQIMAFIFWSVEFAYISKIRMGEVYVFASLGLALAATIVCKYIINYLNR